MTALTELSDEALLRLAASGDENAFLTFYRRRQGSVYRFALHMSGNPSLAEETAQEVFMALIKDFKRFDASKGTVKTYMYGVARNHVLRRLESDRAYVPFEEDSDANNRSSGNPLRDLTQAEIVDYVRQAVLSLPAVYREAVVLCDLEELSYVEAAEALRVPIGTVRSRIARGRGMLVEKLKSAANAKPRPDGFGSMRCLV
ncbi:MAG: RNA polymerase sigma factor [Bryobacteraceae bacterium]